MIYPNISETSKHLLRSILKNSFLSPFNYVRVFGLVLLITSNIFENKPLDVPWIDTILFQNADVFF